MGRKFGFMVVIALSGLLFTTLAFAEGTAEPALRETSGYGLYFYQSSTEGSSSGVVMDTVAGSMIYDPRNTILSFQRFGPWTDPYRVDCFTYDYHDVLSDLTGYRLDLENDQRPGIPDDCYLLGIRFCFKRFGMAEFSRSVNSFFSNVQKSSPREDRSSSVSFYFDMPD